MGFQGILMYVGVKVSFWDNVMFMCIVCLILDMFWGLSYLDVLFGP